MSQPAGLADNGSVRPRRTRMSRTARRAQLLDSARQVFVAQGYHAAAMDDIAERAGVSKPVLYQHFPGKLDLYVGLVEQSCDDVIANCRAALASTNDNQARVEAAMKVFYDYIAAEGSAFRLVFESDLISEPAVREQVDRVTHECALAIAPLIRNDAGLPEAEAHLLAVALVGMAQVSARYWIDRGGSLGLASAADLVAGLAWRGIGGFPLSGDPLPGDPGDG